MAKGTIQKRRGKNNRGLKNFSDDELVNCFSEKFFGNSPNQVKSADPYLYIEVSKRGLLPRLREKGVLVRQTAQNRFNRLDDEALVEYVQERYSGSSPYHIELDEENEGRLLYSTLRRRKLITKLVRQGVLVRKNAVSGMAASMSDKEIISHARRNYNGQAISAFKKEDKTIYDEARSRGLIDVLVEKGILVSGRPRHISSAKDFLSFLERNESARHLSIASLSVNGESYDIEQILLNLYDSRFKDQGHLHSLLQENREGIVNLTGEDLTNLGFYIGDFSLGDKAIIPVLLGETLAQLPDDKITAPLEERILRIQRTVYGPRFNENPSQTLDEISSKIEESPDRLGRIYQRLYDHYQATLQLGGELK